MKEKPNLQTLAFLRGAEATDADAGAVAPRAPRITKTIRIARALDVAVKRLALERSTATHARVTESDVFEEALKQYLEKQSLQA